MNDTSNESQQQAPKSRGGYLLGLIIMVAVLLPIWFFFLGPKLRHDRLVEKGVRAQGRLISVEETGTVVNDSPELELVAEFTRKDGVLDTATTDFVPSLRSLHMYQPGTGVTVAYDPDDPEEITIVSLGVVVPDVSVHLPQLNGTIDSLRRTMDSLRRFADSLVRSVKR